MPMSAQIVSLVPDIMKVMFCGSGFCGLSISSGSDEEKVRPTILKVKLGSGFLVVNQPPVHTNFVGCHSSASESLFMYLRFLMSRIGEKLVTPNKAMCHLIILDIKAWPSYLVIKEGRSCPI